MQKMSDSVKRGLVAVGVVALGATNAMAALTAPTLSTTDYETVAVAVLAGFAVIWGIKKAISLIRA